MATIISRTWGELERMAARIQNSGNAQKAKKIFGVTSGRELPLNLDCNALEWQVSEGGGRIIESDGR